MSTARVALGLLELHLPDVGSLKGKRQIVKSLKEKVKNRFDVSIAEVDHLDSWQRSTLAVACVSHDSRHANEVVDKVMDFMEANAAGYVIDRSVEML